MATRSEAGKAFRDRILKENPDYYSNMGKKGGSNRKNPYYHFKEIAGTKKHKAVSSKGGSSTPGQAV